MIPRLISDFCNSAYIHIPPHTYNTNTEKMEWGREKRETEIL